MEVILMYSIKAKLVFGCIFSFVVFGLILVGQSDALKNPDSVVGVWLLDGDANDSSGNDYHGELTGNPEWIAGKFGMAVDLPGTMESWRSRGYNPDYRLPTALQRTAWRSIGTA
jgi:hypothetical protein